MKFCSECGSANLVLRKTNHDTHSRYTCADCEKIFYHNPKVIAGCIVEHEGKYLMCQRAIKPRTGTWTLPAGFMECGETVEQAAQREVWEETGAKTTEKINSKKSNETRWKKNYKEKKLKKYRKETERREKNKDEKNYYQKQ